MKRLVAIDGGGTKTDLVLLDECGQVLGRVLTAGCNPNDFGWRYAENILREGLSLLLARDGGLDAPIDAVFAGVSGGSVGGNRKLMGDLLKKLMPKARAVSNDSDAVSALSGGIENEDGCVVISGTGSVGFARVRGKIIRVGGWGYLFDRGGSGYDFGRDAVYHALCAADGRGPSTLLTELLERALGASVSQGVTVLYEKGKPAIAALAPLVFEAYRRGDAAAAVILEENGREMAKLFNTLSAHVARDSCKTVLAGGMFKDWPQLAPYVEPLLERAHSFVLPTLPPVYGSAVEAAKLAGYKVTSAFKQTFADGLAECTPIKTEYAI